MKLKILLICLVFIFFAVLTFAQESITITTYYPSPYGVYNEMRANKMVIGDPDSSSTPTPSDGAVTFNPLSAAPTTFSEGSLYYDDSADNFKYYDGSAWKEMGGPSLGGSVMYLRAAYSVAFPQPAFCPAGWTEAYFENQFVGNARNWVRTCYRTDKGCQVMYLACANDNPFPLINCPAGWTEADSQQVNTADAVNRNRVRTCYRCP